LADDDVAAPKILEVVGKGAEGSDDRVWIPARLVLDPLPFDRALSQEILELDRKLAGHALSSFWP
jgi:hypothetical protein